MYGRIRRILPDGSESLIGEFPPRQSQIGLQSALYHRSLSFMELELGHAIFGKPNDWGFVHRMMRVGVRMGMIDAVSVNYWPSLRAHSVSDFHEARAADTSATLLADEDESRGESERETHIAALEHRLTAELQRSAALDAQLVDAEHRLNEVRLSRSWRLTAPLRSLRHRISR